MDLDGVVVGKTCRAITPPSKDACGKTATCRVTFLDGDRAYMCSSCVVAMQEMAEKTFGAMIKVERL